MHQCPLCPKSFPSPFKLQRHYVIHTGQKPFTCSVCGKAFTQSGHLKTHVQKVHRQSRFSTEGLRDGVLTHNQPAAGSNTQGGGNYTLSSAVTSQPEWKSCFSVGNPPKHIPRVNDGSAAQNRISSVVAATPQERADSAHVDTSVCRARNRHTRKVCFKSFTSSLPLWIHSSSHKKAKEFERGGESDQTFSKKAHLKSQELSTSSNETTLKHQCPKCFKSFCSPSKLQRHFLIHTGQKPYSCVICWKSFRQKVHLKAHLSTGNQCSAGDERKKLRFHNARQTSALNSSVELELQCKISVNDVQDLNKTEDVVVKTEPPLNTSSRSQNTWYKSYEQEQQYSTCTDLKPFRCVICNRSFRLEVNLMRHHKIHRNQKELGSPTTVQNSDNVKMFHFEAVKQSPNLSPADLCDLNVIVKPETWSENCSDHNDSLPLELITSAGRQRETCRATSKQQQRINTLHQCCMCLKCFPSASKLQRHTMTHTGQRPFGCEVCGKRFRQKTHLRVHCRTHLWSRYHKQRSLYINRPPSSLSGCNTKTAADVPLQEVLLHKKDFEAHTGSLSVKHLDQTPSMVIIQNDNRQPDKKVWPHTSKKNEVVHVRKVSKGKKTQAAQSRHNPGNARHKCFRCLKCFPSASKLQRHEMVHTGLKPFQCGLCGKAFRQAPHLKTHERTHCERKPSRPVNQQGNIRKLKANSQQKRYPRICFRVPPQERSVSTDATLSRFDGAVRVREPLDTRREKSRTNVNSLFKTNSKSNITCKKRKLHTCRICCKNFAFPYKLSRHMLTHSGIRPYKCSSCSRTFTQRGHQKIHERRCRQGDRIEMMNTNHLQDKCIDSFTDCADFNVDATKDQLPESHYCGAGDYSFTGGDLPYCSEAMHTEWLAVTGVGFQEENNESEKRHIENYSQATPNYSYSFPSELAFEINKLIQNQNTPAPPVSHPYEGNAQNVPCQPKGVTAVPDGNKLLGDEQPDNYWCEPPAVFESDTRAASFKSENDLTRHICSINIQRKTTESTQKNRCDICLKYFVSPSKLKRHYLIHTGQRPFRCDICGRTFTQSGHVRTHRLTHTNTQNVTV